MWLCLAGANIVVNNPAPPEWVQLVQVSMTVGIPVVVTPVWVQMVQVDLDITVPAPTPPPEWVMLTQVSISVKVPGVPEVPPELPPEVPEEVVGFPWIPVALIGGGAVLAAVSIKPEKKKA